MQVRPGWNPTPEKREPQPNEAAMTATQADMIINLLTDIRDLLRDGEIARRGA